MIEDRRRACGVDEHADAAADDQRLGMIYGDPIAAHQFNDIGFEWCATLEAPDRRLEMFRGHVGIISGVGFDFIANQIIRWTAEARRGDRNSPSP